MDNILECIEYLLESEVDDYIQSCIDNNADKKAYRLNTWHIWSIAALAYERHVGELIDVENYLG